MGKISYIFKRIKAMDFDKMKKKINEIHKKTGKSKLSILIDMKNCAVKYGAGYMDYDLFEMYNLTPEQRDTYLTRGRNNELVKKYCDLSYLHYFQSKAEFAKVFGKFIKRDFLNVREASKDDIISFIRKHDEFMIKPDDGSCGKGIEKVNKNDFKSLEDLYKYIIDKEEQVSLEELIIQNDEISSIYPNSINTIRVVTIVTTDEGKSLLSVPEEKRKQVRLVPHIVCTYFRIGNGGKFVDNFNSGGMCAPIDEISGIVKDVAIDKDKNVYENHPQTGTKIKGFQIPYWYEILNMCKEAALVIPEMGYAGWDVGITPDGPVFVEGNEFPGYDIYQLPVHTPDKIGMMSKFTFDK